MNRSRDEFLPCPDFADNQDTAPSLSNHRDPLEHRLHEGIVPQKRLGWVMPCPGVDRSAPSEAFPLLWCDRPSGFENTQVRHTGNRCRVAAKVNDVRWQSTLTYSNDAGSTSGRRVVGTTGRVRHLLGGSAFSASSALSKPSLSRSSLSNTSGGPVNSRRDTSPSPLRSIARNHAGPARRSVPNDCG